MNKIDFILSISENEFLDYFQDQPGLQNSVTKLEYEQAAFLKKVYDHKEDAFKDKEAFLKAREDLAILEDKIPQLEANVANAKHASNIKKYEADLTKARIDRDRLIDRLKNRDEGDLVIARMHYESNRLVAQGIDDWVDKVGAWFETGVLGPGTITYKDKTYTAE